MVGKCDVVFLLPFKLYIGNIRIEPRIFRADSSKSLLESSDIGLQSPGVPHVCIKN